MCTVPTQAANLKLTSMNYWKKQNSKATIFSTFMSTLEMCSHNLSRSSIFIIRLYYNHNLPWHFSLLKLNVWWSCELYLIIIWVIIIFFYQVGFWTSHAKCAATAAQGSTMEFTPVTAARDSSRGASAETGPTSVNLALRWGLSLIYYIFSCITTQAWRGLKVQPLQAGTFFKINIWYFLWRIEQLKGI